VFTRRILSWLAVSLVALCALDCEAEVRHRPGHHRRASAPAAVHPLPVGVSYPPGLESRNSGRMSSRVRRRSHRFSQLTRARGPIEYKDEEGTGADRMMMPELRARVERLSQLVRQEWGSVRLRVTEAWDEQGEHGPRSLHYEGRAVDLTTSDLDSRKLGRLAALAVRAGFDWVYFESRYHVHASVRRTGSAALARATPRRSRIANATP
jgi:hypothetical protein